MTDFSKTLIRCSALGALFTEPKAKVAKESGELSETAKAYLVKLYIQIRWGRYREINAKQTDKGKLVEQEIIDILGFVDNKPYVKNQERRENEWISGEADIVDEIIIDAKGSWDSESFIPRLIEKVDRDHAHQLTGYCWLWNKPAARVSYVLVNCPESILQNERRKLLYNMNVATELNPEYLAAVADLNKNFTFDDIPLDERIIHIDVPRDEEIIRQIPQKVTKAREYLSYLEELHLKKRILPQLK